MATLNRVLEDTRDELIEVERAISRSTERVRESIDEYLTRNGTVTRIHPEPTATVELTEDELQATIERFPPDLDYDSEGQSARGKYIQALAVESGVGGNFHGGGEAA